MSFAFLTDKHHLHFMVVGVRNRMARLQVESIAGILTAGDECLGVLEGCTLTTQSVPGVEEALSAGVGGAIIKGQLKRSMVALAGEAEAELNNGFPVTQVVFRVDVGTCLECELKWLDDRVERVMLGSMPLWVRREAPGPLPFCGKRPAIDLRYRWGNT
jgi:hypothetical protein